MGPSAAEGMQGVVGEVKVEPAGQLAQFAAPESEKVLPGQGVQALALEPPGA